jgi:hypothetical protein
MSGGSFNYEYARMQDFADDLRERLTQQGQVVDGWKIGTWEPAVAVKMEEISHIVDHAAKLAKEVEWLYSGDTGEDTFMRRVQEIELERPWVGLTDDEVEKFHHWKDRTWSTNELVRHVEAKLKEKNA